MNAVGDTAEGSERTVVATAATDEEAAFIVTILEGGCIASELRRSDESVDVLVVSEAAADARRRLRAVPDF